jgi:hypothetical protein
MKPKILTTSSIPHLLTNQFIFKTSDNLSELHEIGLAFEYETTFSDRTRSILGAKGIPIIGGARIDKLVQSLYLEKFQIPHPITYFDETTNQPFRDILTFDSYVELEEFVVKPIVGARGIGVKKINREDYKRCMENSDEVSKVFEKEQEYLKKHQLDVSSTYIENSFRGDMLVQEAIPVMKEFRLLIFKPNNFLVYERVKNPAQFCGNLSHGSTATEVDRKTIENYIEPLLPQLLEMMEELRYPWLSVDVYVDGKGKAGVFEFQMEFAYEGFKPKEVKELMEKSLISYLKPKRTTQQIIDEDYAGGLEMGQILSK